MKTIIMKLTNIARNSLLRHLRVGAERSVVLIELADLIGKSLTSIESWVGNVGLITGIGWKLAKESLALYQNFTDFLR